MLALSPFLYMMQVTERVYSSRSWETLGFITVLTVFLMIVWAVLDHFRASALFAVGHRIDHELREGVFDAVHRGNKPEAFRAYGDITTVQQGLTGPLIEAAMDASLSPIYIVILFLLHPAFGFIAIGYILLLAVLSSRSKSIWQRVRAESREHEDRAFSFGLATATRRETIRAMNILPGVRREWSGLENKASGILLRGQTTANRIDSVISLLQQGQMVILIGAGAVLYLLDAASVNAGMAAFIVMMRGVNPVVSVARNWSMINDVRSAIQRLDIVLADVPADATTLLPEMQGQVSCDNLVVMGTDGKPVLSGIRFDVPAGSVVGIVGPSGAGKSTLLRMLSGAGRPSSGSVKIDGFPLHQWPEAQRGPDIGYLPQSVDLLPGTIMQNVTRFGPVTDAQAIAASEALRLAGALDIVQARGRGLDFRLQEDGAPLSGGQRQRIGLARALYGQPKVLVLDEPNSALDAAGEKTLLESITAVSQRGTTVFFSTHKVNMLGICDYILVIMDGYMHSFSTREDMLRRLTVAGNPLLSNGRADHPNGEARV
ncbi:ATP-binding cassette domain-containing protein (plasmid) [Gemmobacter fulvus]|uniref:ATP-binding cassette domain-containing protein n=1 Tax=Gemmobacter fulvus TaxID=2840474 RepID=A0A975S3Q8_9RHOB|nr:ATP-binding cassette domain-containing protein [Gemmobacter fulvus]MBT9247767.1 ATP-binding cassette domain-containing protein [Gemmobacter fulvus]QWK92977.1 ATP-binding cassette domain-containing protein [Gemmobacter fulvus]